MKRRDPLRHLEQHGCVFLREGSRHSLYWNPASQRTTSVPRHNEIGENLARKICKDLEIPQPDKG